METTTIIRTDRLVWKILVMLVIILKDSEGSVSDNDARLILSDLRDHNARSNRTAASRWQTDPFGACSRACGGGQQHRRVRCIREDRSYPGVVMEMPPATCPTPSPDISRPCNTHRCLGRWWKGPWSTCSVTCGLGVQSRKIVCESFMLNNQQFHVSNIECGGKSPHKYRKCYVRDCPRLHKMSQETILAENYTLIQLKKTRKLRVNIGGELKIFPGQSIAVRCPVRHYSRKLIYWSKGFKMVPMSGRVRVSSGGLRINKADPKKDAGVYTCIAGEKKAAIKVEFTSANSHISKKYRNWAKNSRSRSRRGHSGNANGQEGSRQRGNDIYSLPLVRDTQQRDQGVNRSRTLTYVTSDWSECSVSCGSGGERKRKVMCSYVTLRYVKTVSEDECVHQGLEKPVGVEQCMRGSDCPMWRAGTWSKCSPSCGHVGYKSRYLVCEWEKTGLPAWNACDLANKPSTKKPCKLKPCPKNCKDHSHRCKRVRQFNMCRFNNFREQCCHSCRGSEHPNKIPLW